MSINVVSLKRGEETYIFAFDDEHRAEALRVTGKWASDPELSFNFYDAAKVGKQIRQSKPVEKKPCAPGTLGAELVGQAAHFAQVKAALYAKLKWLAKKHDLDLTLWGQCAFAAGVDFPVHVPIEDAQIASWEDAVLVIKAELKNYLRLLDELGAES